MARTFCFFAFIGIILLASIELSLGQTNRSNFLEAKIDADYADVGLIYILTKLSTINRVPIGFEKSVSEDFQTKINIKSTGRTVKEVLDVIVREEPNYEWTLRDGVVNFVPRKNRAEVLAHLLDLPVSGFFPQPGETKFDLRDDILQLPEVRSYLSDNKLTGVKQYYAYKPSIYSHDKVDLAVTNSTVRGVLNKIISETEHKFWMAELTGDKKENFLLSL